jgi:hypothetical protein
MSNTTPTITISIKDIFQVTSNDMGADTKPKDELLLLSYKLNNEIIAEVKNLLQSKQQDYPEFNLIDSMFYFQDSSVIG